MAITYMLQCNGSKNNISACREALQALIPAMLGAQHGAEEEGDDSLLQGITRGSLQGIMQDRLSSHVMEVSYTTNIIVVIQYMLQQSCSADVAQVLSRLADLF